MDELLKIADLRRLLLNYLTIDTMCQLIELDERLHQTNRIDQDIDYWSTRTLRDYNIPKDEYFKMLNATEDEREIYEAAIDVFLDQTPFKVFCFLQPVMSNNGKYTLPGCDIDNDTYQRLSDEGKCKYPLAKYNFIPKPTCAYVFQRGKYYGKTCGNIISEGSKFCDYCLGKKMPVWA